MERHGKPVAFYGDKVSVFRVNHPHATGGDGHTQFSRALELNIEGICANSSQAKGRVERAHLTLKTGCSRNYVCETDRWVLAGSDPWEG